MIRLLSLTALLTLSLSASALAYSPKQQKQVNKNMALAVKESYKLSLGNTSKATAQTEAAAQQVADGCLPTLAAAAEASTNVGQDVSRDLAGVYELAVLQGATLPTMEQNSLPVMEQYLSNNPEYYLAGASGWLSSYRYLRSILLSPDEFCSLAKEWEATGFNYNKIPRQLEVMISLTSTFSDRMESLGLSYEVRDAYKTFKRYGVSRTAAEWYVKLAFMSYGECMSDTCLIVESTFWRERVSLFPVDEDKIVYAPDSITVPVRVWVSEEGFKLDAWISANPANPNKSKLCSVNVASAPLGVQTLTCKIEGKQARKIQARKGDTNLDLVLKYTGKDDSGGSSFRTVTLKGKS